MELIYKYSTEVTGVTEGWVPRASSAELRKRSRCLRGLFPWGCVKLRLALALGGWSCGEVMGCFNYSHVSTDCGYQPT